jgi:septal ring factor EnvC (AmiA/AmiB activator)
LSIKKGDIYVAVNACLKPVKDDIAQIDQRVKAIMVQLDIIEKRIKELNAQLTSIEDTIKQKPKA